MKYWIISDSLSDASMHKACLLKTRKLINFTIRTKCTDGRNNDWPSIEAYG